MAPRFNVPRARQRLGQGGFRLFGRTKRPTAFVSGQKNHPKGKASLGSVTWIYTAGPLMEVNVVDVPRPMSAIGVKWTCRLHREMSANDPKRTFASKASLGRSESGPRTPVRPNLTAERLI
jgi:hypothetical protein